LGDNELVRIAAEAKKHAYAPYSGFRVGAALMTGGGKVYTGVNIENASYGAAVCAERVAVWKAVSEGETAFKTLAVVSDSDGYTCPCGICRQVLNEFGADMRILCANKALEYRAYTLKTLLPEAFAGRHLKG